MFQPIDFMWKTVCYVQYIIFCLHFSTGAWIIAWHISYTVSLIVCLEIWKIPYGRVYESLVAKNRNVTANLSWTGIAARNLMCLFTIFGPTKLISSSKSAGTIPVNFFCTVHQILGTPYLPTNWYCTTVHGPLSVQLRLPPASFLSLSSSGHVVYIYERRASYL